MNNGSPRDYVQQGLAAMVSEGTRVADLVSQALVGVQGNEQAETALGQLRDMVREQTAAASSRLDALASQDSGREASHPGGEASTAVREVYAGLSGAAAGYASLHATAHRAFDSTGEGNTADLAERHLQRCLEAAQMILQLVSDMAIWGLNSDGVACQCRCPACGLGICVCAPHGTATVRQALGETPPTNAAQGILLVTSPRAGSAAALCGLQIGDTLLAVDNGNISSNVDLQRAIQSHQPGEQIELRVRRAGEVLEVAATKP